MAKIVKLIIIQEKFEIKNVSNNKKRKRENYGRKRVRAIIKLRKKGQSERVLIHL